MLDVLDNEIKTKPLQAEPRANVTCNAGIQSVHPKKDPTGQISIDWVK